jgi:hypothetical protein
MQLFVFFILTLFSQSLTLETFVYQVIDPGDRQFLVKKLQEDEHPAYFPWDSSRSVSIMINYNDVYREWKGSESQYAVFQYGSKLGIRIPFWIKSRPSYFSMRFTNSYLSFFDKVATDDVDFSFSVWPVYTFGVTLAVTAERHKYGVSFDLGRSIYESSLQLKKFPKAENDDLLNRYFYDLLEPTFGRKIDFWFSTWQYSFSGEYFYEFIKGNFIGINVSKSSMSNTTDFNYLNSTEKIAGQKFYKMPLNVDNTSLNLSNEMKIENLSIRFDAGYDFTNIETDINAQNPTKSGDIYLEFLNLGESSFKGKTFKGGLGMSWNDVSKEISVAHTITRTRIKGNGSATTPVLGFEILPIAHRFAGLFDVDIKSSSYQLSFNHKIFSNFSYSVFADYLNTDSELFFDNEANIEFGIGNYKYTEKLVYNIKLYKLELETTINILKKWSIISRINQLIPDVEKQEKKKPVASPGPPKKKGIRKRLRGGTFYNIGLIYSF